MCVQYRTMIAFAALFALVSNHKAEAQVLYTFGDDSTGAPVGALTETSPGLFYGNSGTSSPNVFSITESGQFGTVATLDTAKDGTFPLGPLYPASNGLLYGVTLSNADSSALTGSIYSVSLSGRVQTLAMGLPKLTPLIEASDGNLYGIAFLSGSYTVFRLTLSGKLTLIASLGINPASGALVQASDGALYGATGYAVRSGNLTPGFVYKVSLNGDYSVIATFPKNTGATTSLMQASNGLLYGGAYVAEATCQQTQSFVFTVATSGILTVINSIPECAQQVPQFNGSFIEASDGYIYGTFEGISGGGVFRMPLGGGTLESLVAGVTLPDIGPDGIAQGSDGGVYVVFGGSIVDSNEQIYGSIFRLMLSPPLPPPPLPAPQYTIPASGSVGSAVLIYGSQLLGPTAVSFNGVPATKIVSRGQHYIYAVVPPGATTGPITVNTPNGSGTTPGSFQVE